MKQKISESIEIPQGIDCEIKENTIICKKGPLALSRLINHNLIRAKIQDNKIMLYCDAGNKKQYKIIKAYIAHIKNMFAGLANPYVYTLEAVNVHFPMSLKVDKDKLIISNFLGEKTPRFAKILPNVNVEVKMPKITIISADKEAAGQTAANFEKATKIRNRDRRIFQDGIFITGKPGRNTT
ncbi:MAG: 50S ribosomal protein L6 [Candidatus Pacearchaeota archaeon]